MSPIASCGRVEFGADKHSETALIVAIKGSADYYTVQWAERAGLIRQASDRRRKVAGAAAPVAADPALSDRAG